MKLASFDWDAGNWPKCGKHGVSREEIEEVFTGLPAILADPHLTEPRQRAIGQTQAGRYVFVVFMFRESDQKTLTTMKNKTQQLPSLPSDEAAEDFVSTADLSSYDLTGFKHAKFEFQPKAAALNLRLPQNLLNALKAKAKAQGIPYTRYVRLVLEKDIAQV
jgi:predicted DNA binding CopG/RHH family protein